MATSLVKLLELLRKEGERPYSNGHDSLVILVPDGGHLLPLVVNLIEDGDFVRWLMPSYLTIPTGDAAELAMTRLLKENDRTKLLKFGLRLGDQVSAVLDLPVQDGDLTLEQVRRALFAFYRVAIPGRRRLARLFEAGVHVDDEQERIDNAVRRLLEGTSDDPLNAALGEDEAH